VENSFAEDLNFVPGKKADASAFRSRLYGYFGDTDVNWKKYPELAYDESDETFVVPTLAPSEGNYDYHLDHVLFDESETKLIYVADMIPKSGCQVTLSGNQCTCPAAQYYLELHWDEVAGQMNFIRHYVRRQGEISPVEGQ